MICLWPAGAAAVPGEQAARVLHGHTDEISSLAFSPDGRTLLSSGLDHTARIPMLDGDRRHGSVARRKSVQRGLQSGWATGRGDRL